MVCLKLIKDGDSVHREKLVAEDTSSVWSNILKAEIKWIRYKAALVIFHRHNEYNKLLISVEKVNQFIYSFTMFFNIN